MNDLEKQKLQEGHIFAVMGQVKTFQVRKLSLGTSVHDTSKG